MDLHVDIESASDVDLKVHGLDVYSKHPSTRILMVSWALDDQPVQHWTIHDGSPPQDLIAMLQNPTIRKWAWNAQFEQVMFSEVWMIDTPIEQWRCAMVWSLMLGLPGALDKAGEILRLPDTMLKLKDGKRLIRKFCVKQKATKKQPARWYDVTTHPEEWQLFCEYNRQDTVAERFVVNHRLARYPIPDNEWRIWHIGYQHNQRGWPTDRQMVSNAVKAVNQRLKIVMTDLKELTGLANPNSGPQFGAWARANGYPFGDLRKATVVRAQEHPECEIIKPALALRAELQKTSVKKFVKIHQQLADDDRLRYQYQFSGAKRTGRTAGRGAQLQNLSKCAKHLDPYYEDIVEALRENDIEWIAMMYGNPMVALSSVQRGVFRAQVGKSLIVADLASIEACVIAWLARCKSMLDVFYQGLDIYKVFATQMFHISYDEVTKAQRTLAKPPVLGCGFRLSGGEEIEDAKTGDMKKTGLWGYAEGLSIAMTREEAHLGVRVYREAYPEVVQLWYDLEKAAKQVIIRGGSAAVGPLIFDRKDPFLRLILPSGRALHYLRPKIEPKRTPWGETRPTITYEGEEDEGGSKFWGRTPTHGGVLAENATQAVANDLLRIGIEAAHEEDFELVGESHDELIAHEDGDPEEKLKSLCACLTRGARWAQGLPLSAAGFTADFYRKD